MLRLLVASLPTLRSALRARRDLVIENLALRQQLATLAGRRHPVIRPADRLFWILLRRWWSGWAECLAIVRPATVVRWHRAGFRIYWRRALRSPFPAARGSRPHQEDGHRESVGRSPHPRRAPSPWLRPVRVSRYLRSLPSAPGTGQTWTTFLRNHRNNIAAMDFFSVPTVTFRVLQVLLGIRHGRRVVAHCAVAANPTAAWVAQQLREAFPFDSAPRFMIFDRGAIFSSAVTATLRSLLVEPTRTSYRSPWQNGVAERFVATVRRELLDHVIVLNERHLRQLIGSFVAYYNVDRTHLGLGKDSPCGRPVEQHPGAGSSIVSLPRVGGLHHRYAWRQAA